MRNREKWPAKPLPRPVRYAWGAAVSLLLFLSLVLDSGSRWHPLVDTLIDVLQVQGQPEKSEAGAGRDN